MGGSAGALREAVWTSHGRESRGHEDGVCSLYYLPEVSFYSWHTAVRDLDLPGVPGGLHLQSGCPSLPGCECRGLIWSPP
jgi:hypothetical protein